MKRKDIFKSFWKKIAEIKRRANKQRLKINIKY